MLPLFSLSSGSTPSSGEKGASAVPESSPKQCPGCLGRDSISSAAARVGPAVVNISIHQGILHILSNFFSWLGFRVLRLSFVNFSCVFVGKFGIGVGKGIGSGTIIDKDGTILTCAHAVVDFHGARVVSNGKVGFLGLPMCSHCCLYERLFEFCF